LHKDLILPLMWKMSLLGGFWVPLRLLHPLRLTLLLMEKFRALL
jgi:hypothetical protein